MNNLENGDSKRHKYNFGEMTLLEKLEFGRNILSKAQLAIENREFDRAKMELKDVERNVLPYSHPLSDTNVLLRAEIDVLVKRLYDLKGDDK